VTRTKEQARAVRAHRIALGLCVMCGDQRDGTYKDKCVRCAIRARILNREKRGHKEWSGRRGRPPIVPEELSYLYSQVPATDDQKTIRQLKNELRECRERCAQLEHCLKQQVEP